MKENGPKKALKEKEDKRQRYRIAIIIVLFLLIITLLIVNYANDAFNKKDNVVDPQAVVGQLDGKTPAEIQEELDRVVSKSSLVISINTKIEMKNGSAKAPVKIENVPNNHYAIQVTIKLKDSDTAIYESGLIEPNYHIEAAAFDTVLKKGTYHAIAVFSAYTMDTSKYVGKQQAELTIIVKK